MPRPFGAQQKKICADENVCGVYLLFYFVDQSNFDIKACPLPLPEGSRILVREPRTTEFKSLIPGGPSSYRYSANIVLGNFGLKTARLRKEIVEP